VGQFGVGVNSSSQPGVAGSLLSRRIQWARNTLGVKQVETISEKKIFEQ
jgi:hypothetical protein